MGNYFDLKEILLWTKESKSYYIPRYDYEPSYDEAPAPEDESSAFYKKTRNCLANKTMYSANILNILLKINLNKLGLSKLIRI